MLECMSRAKSEKSEAPARQFGRMNQAKILARTAHESAATSFGIASLPSDNMNLIMNNNFEKEYITLKQAHDSQVREKQLADALRGKTSGDTRANLLKHEKGNAHANKLRQAEPLAYQLAKTSRVRHSLSLAKSSQLNESEAQGSITEPPSRLPEIKKSRAGHSKQTGSQKHVRRALDEGLVPS